ncbi:hypothetical protein GF318_05910 [Candidatus Micrarchaeota archaeon]|nr:hypothetical protein [Candidatus Micrarchaeota archaeon]
MDLRELDRALDSPPSGTPQSLADKVRQIVKQAPGLPENDRQMEAVSAELQNVLDSIVTGLSPSRAPPVVPCRNAGVR